MEIPWERAADFFEREARRFGLSPEEAEDKLEVFWRYNSYRGLHLSFEVRKPTNREEVKPRGKDNTGV